MYKFVHDSAWCIGAIMCWEIVKYWHVNIPVITFDAFVPALLFQYISKSCLQLIQE